jgi:hypothetical protein
MKDNENYNKIANKLANIDDKFIEIESIIKMLNIWVKEKDYELIPVMNILNNKINDLVQILRK